MNDPSNLTPGEHTPGESQAARPSLNEPGPPAAEPPVDAREGADASAADVAAGEPTLPKPAARPRTRRRQISGSGCGLAVLLAGLTLLYIAVRPVWDRWWTPDRFAYMRYDVQVQTQLLTVMMTAWLGFIGGCVGSFLNVVNYRLPAGRTILGTSHCPLCDGPIRAWHNVPILGWFFLDGRCYDCRARIPFRYPLIEALVAGVFWIVAAGELFRGGRNLPFHSEPWRTGPLELLTGHSGELVAIYALHVIVIATLISWATILHDGARLPAAYPLTMLTAALVAGSLAPFLLPVDPAADLDRLNAVVGGLAGAAFGSWLWYLSSGLGSRNVRASGWLPTASAYALVGLGFGIGGLASVAIIDGTLRQTWWWLRRRRAIESMWLATLPLAALLQVLLWRETSEVIWWPSTGSPLWMLIGVLFYAGVLSAVPLRRRHPAWH